MGGKIVLPIDKADDFKANLEKYDQPLVSWTTYQAHRGEALDAIAKRHGTTPAQLKSANSDLKLDKRARLKVAGPVMVPIKRDPNATIKVAQLAAVESVPAARAAAPAKATPAKAAPPAKTASASLYTVRAGDTLYNIAQRYRTTVDALLSLNRLSAKTVLQPGLRLQLP